MTNEYTPTTEEVRESLVEATRSAFGGTVAEIVVTNFDRWLTAHDAGVRATALEEAAQIADNRLHPDDPNCAFCVITAAIRAVQENPGKDNQ